MASSQDATPVDDLKPQHGPFQFSIRRLMLWTVVWAICLGFPCSFALPPFAVLCWAVYFATLFVIRVRWGYQQGRVIAGFVMGGLAAACFAGLLFSAMAKGSGDVLGISLWMLAVCLAGFLLGFYGYFVMHVVANVVDWIDNATRTTKPGDHDPIP